MERWGLWLTLYVKLMHALRRGFGLHLYSVFEGPYEADRAAVDIPSELELHILTTDEILSYVNAPQLDFRDASVNAAIARGDVCVGALKDHQFVAYSWRALRGPVPHTGGWDVVWNPGLVYRYKALTLPEFRGLHLNEALSQKIDGHLAQLGHPMGLSFVDTVNLPSLRSAVRKGRRRIGYAGYLQKFGAHLPFRTAGCRASGFAFRRANSN